MDIWTKVAYIFVDLVLPLVLGYMGKKNNWLSEVVCNKMISVNIVILCTALSLLSFWVLPLKPELLWLPMFGVLLSFIPGIPAYWISRYKYEGGLEKGSYLASAMLSNIGLLGGLCVFILLGELGFAYTQIIALFQNLVLLLFCFPMAQYYGQQQNEHRTPRISFADLFLNRNQLSLVGMAVGIILCVSGIPRPALLDSAFPVIVHISAWTALLPVGYSIEFAAMKQYYTGILDLIPIKFIVTPVTAYFIARQLFTDSTVLSTILVLGSVPTGVNAIITARLYHLNLPLTGAAFVLTTAFFLIIVYPVLFFWFI